MKREPQGISEIVGSVPVKGRARAKVYRALRTLICASCGAAIEEGALFTRRKHTGFALSIMPMCAECAPFTWPDEATPQSEDSGLIESLLAATQNSEQPTPAPYARTQKKINSRLAPALSRSRRGRDDRGDS